VRSEGDHLIPAFVEFNDPPSDENRESENVGETADEDGEHADSGTPREEDSVDENPSKMMKQLLKMELRALEVRGNRRWSCRR
jgi:hypothetical protein